MRSHVSLVSDTAHREMILVEDLGGITQTTVNLDQGVTVLAGPNATNKTSFLKSVAAALGGTGPVPRSDAGSGRVRLELGGREYSREYERNGGEVTASGTPFTNATDLVDTFVALLESNPIRRAVEQGEDLRDLLMMPVDEATIQAEIEQVKTERERVDEQLQTITEDAERLPELTERRDSLLERLNEVESEISSLEESLTEQTAAIDHPTGAGGSQDDPTAKLQSARQDLHEIRERMERERNSLEALRDERRTVQQERHSIDVDEREVERLNEKLDHLEERSRHLDEMVSDLSTVVNFNERVVETDYLEEIGAVTDEQTTAALDPSSMEIECWTCGSKIVRKEVTDRLEGMRSLIEEKRSEQSDVNERIRSLREQRSEAEAAVERNRQLKKRLEKIETEIERRETRLQDLKTDATACHERIETAEAEIAKQDGTDEETIERRERFSELEYERGRIEAELAAVRSEISEIESSLDRREDLRERRSELTDELASLRSRIEDLEREVVNTFNEQAQALLDHLEYENIERIRLERVVEGPTLGSTHRQHSRFEMYLTRTDESGTAFSGSVETLSESERTVVGLTAALAGYLAHDIHDEVPVLLLDSLEAVDAIRIGPLIDYLATYVDYLIVALLPADAESVSNEYRVIPSTEL